MASNELKAVLIKEGLKQSELAGEAGVSQGTVNKVCNGKLMPAPTTRNRLVAALNRLLKSEKYRVEDIFPGAK